MDPFKSYKHAERNWSTARSKGFEVVVALDDRTSKEDEARVRSLADKVFLWESQGFCELAYRFVQRCSSDFVLMVADDEEPSEMCWDFAQNPPFPARFGIPIIPIKDRKVWTYDVGVSDRLLHRRGWRWIGGFEGHSEGARMVTMSDNPGVLIWHYLLDAPLEERIAKAARYTIVSGRPETDKDNLRRVLWEDNPGALRDLPPQLARLLPKETPNGETLDGSAQGAAEERFPSTV